MSSLHRFKLLPVVLALMLHAAFAQAPIADESAAIANAAQHFMASGKPMLVSAAKLREMLANPTTAPALISICAPDDYAKARLPGSINIPRGVFWKTSMLAKLPPKDRMIVAYCYNGTGAAGPAVVLNLMGYNAVQLEWGTMGWSRNDAVLGQATRFPESQQNYPVVQWPQGSAVSCARPIVATGKTTLAEVLVARGDAVESADRTVSMTSEVVQALLADDIPGNDPFVVDVRAPADFVKGHIRGAINIPTAEVYLAGNLAKLPLGRRIVVADYTGQTAVGYSYLLSIMGYNARGLQYGMMGWSINDALLGGFKRFPSDLQHDFPITGAAAR